MVKILKAKMAKTASLYLKYEAIKDSAIDLKKLQDTASYDQLSKVQSVSCMGTSKTRPIWPTSRVPSS